MDLPLPDALVSASGPAWGNACEPLTPAYWAAQSWMWEIARPDHFRLGRGLAEEVLACMLGGYGIPAEIGMAAYERLRAEARVRPSSLSDAKEVERLLSTPLSVAGRAVRYRFARQKAAYVAEAFRALPMIDEALADLPLRNALLALRGIGPKTASWIVRNLRASDDVAILDVHILRAGGLLGIFDRAWRVEKHYDELEQAYLGFASAIGARASTLDSVMWMTMRQLPLAKPAAVVREPHAREPRRDARQPSLAL